MYIFRQFLQFLKCIHNSHLVLAATHVCKCNLQSYSIKLVIKENVKHCTGQEYSLIYLPFWQWIAFGMQPSDWPFIWPIVPSSKHVLLYFPYEIAHVKLPESLLKSKYVASPWTQIWLLAIAGKQIAKTWVFCDKSKSAVTLLLVFLEEIVCVYIYKCFASIFICLIELSRQLSNFSLLPLPIS